MVQTEVELGIYLNPTVLNPTLTHSLLYRYGMGTMYVRSLLLTLHAHLWSYRDQLKCLSAATNMKM